MPGMVPTSDFSGFVSSSCAFARAAAIVPIDSLEGCMAALHRDDVEADRTGFRPLGPNPVSERFFGVLRHECLELALGTLMFEVGRTGPAVHGRELRPRVRGAHVDGPHRLDVWTRRLNAEGPGLFPGLDAPQKPLLGREQRRAC